LLGLFFTISANGFVELPDGFLRLIDLAAEITVYSATLVRARASV